MLRNTMYIGRIDCSEYGVSTRGDFEPLVSEETFYRAQAVSAGPVQVSGPRERNHPDFPSQRLRTLRDVWSAADRQLVERAQRSLR